MQGINKVILVGHLGHDPEIKYTTSNTTVANCSIATSERWKDKNGNTNQLTEWHSVVFFNKLADIVAAYLVKGSNVYIEGKLKTEKYTDKEGIERYKTKIIANNLQMLGGGKSKDESANNSKKDNAVYDEKYIDAQCFDDDIPF